MRDRKRSLVWYTVLAAVLAVGVISSWPLAEVFAQGPTGGASGNADPEGLNFFSLLIKGSYFMLPILVMSLLVVTFTIERFIGLRRDRVLPQDLITGLGQLGGPQSSFDPRQAYRLCQQHTSAASAVVRAMLVKVGRPHSEVERAVAEASEREAGKLYANVRWLNLAAAITPLMGLLGTVWGMIRAFHDTTQLSPGQNKADYLAEGIYVALITTLGGLMVAIPAAIFAHYFEGRIQSLFLQIDEMLFSLMPQIERFEGKVRFGQPAEDSNGAAHERGAVSPPPVQEPTAAGE
ncbi:MAG: MotA/TolQ/ExbB proton channel family protein [Pirellulaceae bacterium]|jgi:biopolymer transport protein ExbB|nr:MotA/TolQ/ExbB proton channel family protein [Pirellulaceae bacterium]HJN07926.1 MotA/TolQ/ExbB proton channel family protein [Pirellulaceae bacterium]